MKVATRFGSPGTISALVVALSCAAAMPTAAGTPVSSTSHSATTACDPKADLTAQLSILGTRGTFTNNSATCSYDIGIAAYRMFDNRLRNQAIFDWATAPIAPGESRILNVELPDCSTQVDLFAGPVVMSFANDNYRGRFLTGRLMKLRLGFCDPAPCTLTQGFWSTHSAAWPVQTMMLGSREYSQPELLAILAMPVEGNGLVGLAHQLIAAKLNLASGVNAAAVHTAITDGDAMIDGAIIPPSGSGFLSTAAVEQLVEALDAFNNGIAGPSACS